MKLKDFILEKSERVGSKNIPIFGVNNQTGIDTSKDISDNTTNYKIIKKNYFAYNPYRINVGSIGLFKGEIGGVSPAYMVFGVDETKLNPDFLFVFLKSLLGNIEINKYTFGAVRKSLNLKGLGKIEIPNLSLEEQNIFLENYDKFKNNFDNLSKITDKNLSYIKQLKQSILQEAIEGKLTTSWRKENPGVESAFILLEKIKKEKEELIKQKKLKKQEKLKEISENEIPFEIPENWSWCRLGEIYTYIQRGPSAKYSENSNVGIINQKCIRWDKIEYSFIKYYDKSLIDKLSEERFIIKGDILMNSTGTGTIGRCYLVKNIDERKYIADSHVTILRELTNFIDNGYITLFLSSDIIQDYINNGGIGGATNQIELSKSILENFIIPLPPLEEQKEIVKKVDEMMKFCLNLEKQSLETKENSENLMKSILSEVFR